MNVYQAAQGTNAGGDASAFFTLRVKAVIREIADACSIAFELPEELASRFVYKPGQFLTLCVHEGGHAHYRPYSLASSPKVDADLKIAIKRVPQGRVSNWLLDRVQAGDELLVAPPKGVFCVRDGGSPVVLFGAGSGITPLISILKDLLYASSRSVTLVYANRDERSIIFRYELEKLQTRFAKRFTLINRLDVKQGAMTPADVASYVEPDAEYYLCGPAPFMANVKNGLAMLATPGERIFSESFTAEATPVAMDAADFTPKGEASKVVIRYRDQEQTIEVLASETVHAAAARQGLSLPYSCKAGFCGLCMARVRSGEIRLNENLGALSDAQIEEGLTLTCQAYVISAEAALVFE